MALEFAIIFALRSLGANSPYVIGCSNLTPIDVLYRPQVLIQTANHQFVPIAMQRTQQTLPFELPVFFIFITTWFN